MLDRLTHHVTILAVNGDRNARLLRPMRDARADKAFDVAAFVADLHGRRVTPHITINNHLTKSGKRRRTTIGGRTTRHPGFAVSQRIRKQIEEAFGWIKAAARHAKTRFRGTARVEAAFTLATVAYNLVRLPRLLAGASL